VGIWGPMQVKERGAGADAGRRHRGARLIYGRMCNAVPANVRDRACDAAALAPAAARMHRRLPTCVPYEDLLPVLTHESPDSLRTVAARYLPAVRRIRDR
jgi:hypothetical protein